jgi:DNA-binding response OmpR family regulator
MRHTKTALLIVDDSREVRDLVRLALKDRFQVHEAADAVHGHELALAFRPAVLLLDIDLGGPVTGIDLLRRLRADARLADSRVVMVTGSTDDRDCARAMTLGAEAYFSKPFSPLQLAAWIEDLVSTTHSFRETEQ